MLSLFLGVGILYGQSSSLKGLLVDTANGKSIQNACVLLLKLEDSTLMRFTRSTADGSVTMRDLPDGKYLLLITHPEFDVYHFLVKTPVNLGTVYLQPKGTTLAAAIVTQSRAILRIRGDTLEYDAGSVKVKTNGSVEDLLKRLPGVEVNQKGEITAQGEKIQKVLIDGEEFFSDDPTITTRNLSASMVDKIQILNKGSVQSELTGIQSGSSTRTLNISLREDTKQGLFGKLEAGLGFEPRLQSERFTRNFQGQAKAGYFWNGFQYWSIADYRWWSSRFRRRGAYITPC
ncbi:hypothetical protein ACQ86N_01395 [Puia sp. P3]|uniref:hypothetical protein n=1 Tax=Puia sp. P3 TaxID=3423952 RepID=UPI003D6689FD